MPSHLSIFSLIISATFVIFSVSCGPSGRDRNAGATDPPGPTPEKAIAIHHRFDLPIATRGVRPAGLSVGDPVWALLPYPSEPKKYRLTQGTLVAADDAGATVENSGSITGAIPWSVIRALVRADVKPGQAVLAGGPSGLFAGRIAATDAAGPSGDPVAIHRIWRHDTRRDPTSRLNLLVQTGVRDYGQIVFFQDRGAWHQGVWLLSEDRHAWVVQGLGGVVLRVSEVETHPWNPTFVPTQGQKVEACRSGASMLQRAVVHRALPHGLFFEIQLPNGAVRTHVPFWEILPAGSVL